MKIKDFESLGYELDIIHFRYVDYGNVSFAGVEKIPVNFEVGRVSKDLIYAYDIRRNGLDFWPKGGITMVTAKHETRPELAEIAICNNKDNYDKAKGVQICLGRMAKKATFNS